MPAFILGFIVFLFSVVMMWRHRQARRVGLTSEELPETDELTATDAKVAKIEIRFVKSQYRRRMQSTALVAIIGLLLMISPLVANPWFALAYWLVVMLLLGWVMLLALFDFLNTKAHFSRLQTQYHAEQSALQKKVNELTRHGSNGHR